MAPGMKIWLSLLSAGLVIIGLWALPPESWESRFAAERADRLQLLPPRLAHTRVRAQVDELNWRYQRTQWRDSLASLARDSREGKGWVAVLPPSHSEFLKPGLDRAVEAQLQANGIVEPLVPVGIVLMEGRHGTHPAVDPRWSRASYGLEIYVSRDREEPFCFLVQPVHGIGPNLNRRWERLVWSPPGSSQAPSPLGPCAFHAKYGNPGSGVFDWLAAGRYALGLGGSELRRTEPSGVTQSAWFQFARGKRILWFDGFPEAEACLAGKPVECRRAVLEGSSFWSRGRLPDTIFHETGVVARVPEFGYGLPFGGREFSLLWELESEFGSQRFEAFWSSELPIEEAFEGAFAVGLPEWVMGWSQAAFGVSEVGPGVPLNATLLSFLSIGLFSGAALFLGRRRG